MAQSSVIREFLIQLGFKLDKPALDSFETGIKKATVSVALLGTAVTGLAIEMAAALSRIASNLETLYFASIRTGSSATALKSYDLAMQNLGASAGEGLAAMEGLAHAMRLNPGNEGLLSYLIGNVKHLKDGTVDAHDAMLRLADPLSKMPLYLAEQMASRLEIPEKVLLAMRSGDYQKAIEAADKATANMGLDKAVKDAHEFETQLRSLIPQLEVFGIQVFEAIAVKLGVNIKDVGGWLQQHGPHIAQRIGDIVKSIVDFVEGFVPKVKTLVGWFMSMDRATGGWSTKILGLLALLKLFGGMDIISGIFKLGSAFASLAIAPEVLAFVAAGGLVAAAGYGLYKGGKYLWEKMQNNTDSGFGARLLAAGGNNRARDNVAVLNPLAYLTDRSSFSKEQMIGLLANFQAESGMDPTAVGDHGKAFGIGQWHADRQAAFKEWSGHDIHGSGVADQLDFAIHELMSGSEQRAGALLRGTNNADAAARVVANYYERPAATKREADERAKIAAQIEQDTTINVYGNDPTATAKQVAGHQDRVNAKLASNFAGAVR